MRKNTTNYRGRFEILSGITTLQKSIQGAFIMSKSTTFLYQLARAANDIEKLASEIGLYVASADVSASCAFKFDE